MADYPIANIEPATHLSPILQLAVDAAIDLARRREPISARIVAEAIGLPPWIGDWLWRVEDLEADRGQ